MRKSPWERHTVALQLIMTPPDGIWPPSQQVRCSKRCLTVETGARRNTGRDSHLSHPLYYSLNSAPKCQVIQSRCFSLNDVPNLDFVQFVTPDWRQHPTPYLLTPGTALNLLAGQIDPPHCCLSSSPVIPGASPIFENKWESPEHLFGLLSCASLEKNVLQRSCEIPACSFEYFVGCAPVSLPEMRERCVDWAGRLSRRSKERPASVCPVFGKG